MLDSCPFARLPASLLEGRYEIGNSRASTLGRRPAWRRAIAGRFYGVASFAILRIGPRSAPLERSLWYARRLLLGRSAARPAESRIAPSPAGPSRVKTIGISPLGESGRGGFGDNQTGLSFRFQPPLSHVPLTSGLGSDGPARVVGPLLRVQGVRARAVWYPIPTTRRRASFAVGFPRILRW